jgi:heme exporter protein CcmD
MNAVTPAGVIQGGWGFVVAAYAVTAFVLAAYALSIYLRYRAERRRAARQSGGEGTIR